MAELPAGLMAELPDQPSDDPIRYLRPTPVAPPVDRISSVADRIRRQDARIRRQDARIRPDRCRCSPPSRSQSEAMSGRSLVHRHCFSMGSSPILHLIGCQETAQPHPTGHPIGFATPMVGLARPRSQGRRARTSRLRRRHRCPAGRHLAPHFPFRPAWAPVPFPGNR